MRHAIQYATPRCHAIAEGEGRPDREQMNAFMLSALFSPLVCPDEKCQPEPPGG